MMNYAVTHVTRYAYSDPVTVCHNRICLRPRETDRQRVLRFELTVVPEPAAFNSYVDGDGNHLVSFEISTSHQAMTIRACSEVRVQTAAWPDPSATPPWEQARRVTGVNGAAHDLAVVPFCFASPFVPLEDVLGEYAAESFPPGVPLLQGLLHLMDRMHRDFTFDPKATEVSTKVLESFAARRGVCQDFAHILCGCLRSLGIPTRYVSGYLETKPPPGKLKLAGADASHAWISVFCPGFGWIDLDPTNNVLPGNSYVTIGWGRDYGDVSPVKGVVRGGGGHTLTVAVDVVELGISVVSQI
jgi:transglutaminase-like putative cysteine protease